MDAVFLFTPATRFDPGVRDPSYGADVVMIDLEDSVHVNAKEAARSRLGSMTLNESMRDGLRLGVRINPISTPAGIRDLDVLIGILQRGNLPITYLNVPKVRSPEEVLLYRELTSGLPRPPLIMPLIETTAAIDCIDRIAGVSDIMLFGQADLVAGLYQPNATYVAYARARFCVACAGRDIPAIDTNSFSIDDDALVRRESEAARVEGFTGKAVIHPRQVASVTETFKLSAAELERYRQTIERYEQASLGFSIDTQDIIAPPFVAKARRMLSFYGRDVA